MPDGAVELYHNNVKTFETATNGAFVLGPEGGDCYIYLLADEGDDNADKWLVQAESDGYFAVKSYASGSYDLSIKATGQAGVDLYNNGQVRYSTTGAGSTSVGISTVQDFSAIGMLKERVRIMANKLSAATNINVDEGNIWYFTTNETATATPNIRYSASESLNNKMLIGDTITVSIIYKPNGAGYYAALTVDGSAVTEEWNGGAAPSAANAGGYDVLTHTLAKTADATFLCLSNVQNYA